MRVDMHIHSEYSPDGSVPIKDVLKWARKIGIGAVAITDHNEIKGALEARKLKILPVIRGIEISTASGHVLAYGLDCKVPRDLSIEETIEKIHECGGIAVAAHPYRYWSGIGEDNVRKHNFDAIEVFNSRCKSKSNKKARKLCEEMKKTFTAGSDAHIIEHVGRAGIIVEGQTEEEIIEEILKMRVKTFGTSRNMADTLKYVKKAVGEWAARGFKKI